MIFIPRYQRHFSWDKEHFDRFLEDITKDIKAEDEKEPRTFLGSIICYWARAGMVPGLPEDLPPTTHLIIDGQQRITMIATMAILLHYKISTLCYKGGEEWVAQESGQTLDKLINIFSVDMGNAIKVPKIIREGADIWRKDGEGEYSSPIASFTHRYLKYLGNPSSDSFEIDSASESCVFNKLAKKLNKTIESFPKKDIAKDLRNDRRFMREIWKEVEVDDALALMDEDKKLFDSLLLAKFLCMQMYVIRVDILDKYEGSYAIFDRLNTAGASLNIFESFKPNIIRVMGNKYSGSTQEKIVNEIEEGYVEIEDNDLCGAYVSELITSFALAYSGHKLSKDLNKQRKYLLEEFEKPSKKLERLQEYLECLRSVNKMKQLFGEKQDGLQMFLRMHKISIPDKPERALDEASFCLRFLNEARFKITIPLLAVYLHQVLKLKDHSSIKQFFDAIRITAAFCAIWRSSAEGTNNIDDRIRRVMNDSHKNGVMQLQAFVENKGAAPLSSNELRKLFRQYIEAEYKQIKDARTWGLEMSQKQIYKNTGLVRFILLVGSHNTQATKKGRKVFLEELKEDSFDLITARSFDNARFQEVEHIIPRKEGKGTDSGYTNEQKNQLWNLTLVPSPVNPSLSNKDWQVKHAMYRYFSAQTPTENNQAIKELKTVLSSRQVGQFLKTHKEQGHLSMTKYLSLLNTKIFKSHHSTARNKVIIDNCWSKIAEEWLGWKSENN